MLLYQAAHSASVALAATASITTWDMIGENGAVLYRERAFFDISTATLTSNSSVRNRGVILGAANGFGHLSIKKKKMKILYIRGRSAHVRRINVNMTARKWNQWPLRFVSLWIKCRIWRKERTKAEYITPDDDSDMSSVMGVLLSVIKPVTVVYSWVAPSTLTSTPLATAALARALISFWSFAESAADSVRNVEQLK